MVRPPYVDSNGLKKGAWSEEEDNKLRAYILKYGHWNWRQLPKYAGLARCGKSCRLRWVNYLKPGLKKGNFTKQEEDLIIQLHAQLGNKWSAIAAKLPGRTDNEIKNFWHTHVDRRRKRNTPAKNVKGHTNYESTPSKVTLRETTPNKATSADAIIQHTTPSLDAYDFSLLSTTPLDWINADDDHICISSDYVAQPVQDDFWANISDSQSEIIGYVSPNEVGGFYDPLLLYF